jgi:hypothetical protein
MATKRVQAILALAQAAYTARYSQTALPPDAAEALAQLTDAPAPFPALGACLRAVADGQAVPGVPAGLPAPLRAMMETLVAALE